MTVHAFYRTQLGKEAALLAYAMRLDSDSATSLALAASHVDGNRLGNKFMGMVRVAQDIVALEQERDELNEERVPLEELNEWGELDAESRAIEAEDGEDTESKLSRRDRAKARARLVAITARIAVINQTLEGTQAKDATGNDNHVRKSPGLRSLLYDMYMAFGYDRLNCLHAKVVEPWHDSLDREESRLLALAEQEDTDTPTGNLIRLVGKVPCLQGLREWCVLRTLRKDGGNKVRGK